MKVLFVEKVARVIKGKKKLESQLEIKISTRGKR